MASENESRHSWFKKISFGVNTTSALTLVFLVLAAMTGAYIWGVITGRGMATPVAESAPDEPPVPVSELPPDKILQAHELGFTQALRDEARKPQIEPAPVASAPASTIPAPAAPEASVQKPEENTQPADVEMETNSIYDFVFQVAALREAGAADTLRQSLEGEGLRTRLAQNGNLYLVLVLMRGNASRVTELNNIAQQMRLGDPLLRSKKPVSPTAQARPAASQPSKEN